MATLRNSFAIPEDVGLGAAIQDQNVANGMGSLRRGFEVGRIGTELNPMRTEALDAQIAGDTAKESSLRGRIQSLEQRQQRYAPEVGRVEDINGVGDAFSWAGGQVGQGVASMLDPVAVSAGLSGAGRIASKLPGIGKGIGLGLQGAAMGVPALMSKQQLTGEFIGSAEQDEALMARTAPQALRDQAGTYGSLAAIPDSFLPSLIGRQLTGAGLRAGVSSLGTGTRTGLAMAGEGATETAQSAGSQFALGQLNPDRDTSGDASELINSFAGGAIGSGPLALAGAAADSGYRRVGDTAERIGTAAGQAYDISRDGMKRVGDAAAPYVGQAADAAAPYVEKAKGMFGKLKTDTVDLMADENGNVTKDSVTAAMRKAGEGVTKGRLSAEDASILKNVAPPEFDIPNNQTPTPEQDAALMDWAEQNEAKRAVLVENKLAEMVQEGDPEAQAMMDKVQQAKTLDDTDDQQVVYKEAADFLLKSTPIGRTSERAGALAGAVGRAAATGAKTAFGFAKDMAKGFQEGAASKKNAQVAPEQEGFAQYRDRVYGVKGAEAADQALKQGASYVKAVEFTQRADLAAAYLESIAASNTMRFKGATGLARQAAFSLADMVDAQTSAKASVTRAMRIVTDIHDIYKGRAPEVVRQLGQILGPQSSAVVKQMTSMLQEQMGPEGRSNYAAQRQQLAGEVAAMVGIAEAQALMDQKVNIFDEEQAEKLLNTMELLADGIGVRPGMRKALEDAFGAEGVSKMLELLGGIAEVKKGTDTREVVVDDTGRASIEEDLDPNADDGTVDGPDAFEKRQAEKAFGRGVAAPAYAFGGGLGLRAGDGSNPFDPTERTTSKKRAERSLAGEAPVKRPTLFTKDEKAFNPDSKKYDGEDLIEQRKKQVLKELSAPAEYDIEEKSAAEVMKSLNLQSGAILAAYRDYLRMDAENTSGRYTRTPEQVAEMKSKANRMNKAMERIIRTSKGEEAPRLSLNERKERIALAEEIVDKGLEGITVDQYEYDQLLKEANEYFSKRFVVTATQMTNEVPEQITFAEFSQMKKMGDRVKSLLRKNAANADDALYDEMVSEANLLVFPTVDAKGEPGEIVIPAGKLVEWVKRTRGKYESDPKTGEKFSNFAKNKQYREAVMAGAYALATSPFVTGLPYKLNAGGEQESFTDGIPPSLQLATAIEAKDQADRAKLVAKRVARSGPSQSAYIDKDSDKYQEMVGVDQDKDFSVVDDLEEVDSQVGEISGIRSKRRSGKDDKRAAAQATGRESTLETIERTDRDLPDYDTPDTPRDPIKGLRVDRSGQRVADPKTGSWEETPLDFFPEQKPGEMPDDFADQQFRTRQTMEGFALPKAKMAAFRAAKRTAEGLTALMSSDPTRAREVIMAHLRTAMQGEAYNARGVTGDAYHIAAIVHMLDNNKNPKNPNAKSNFERLQAAGAPPNLISGMERAALTVLIRAVQGDNSISDSHARSLYKMLEGTDDNLKQMQAKLVARGQIDLDKLGTYASPKRPAAPKVDVKPKPLGLNPSRATDKVDENNVPSGSSSFKRTPNKITGAPGEPSRTVSQEFVDRQTAEATAGVFPKTAAPEVANAGLPKDQPTQSGKVELGGTGPYAAKDQAKSDRANKFIGRGSAASSTAKYAKAWGDRANSGGYTATDKVFVSAEGNRTGRLSPSLTELGKATSAGATIITDAAGDRNRAYNSGEREVASYLESVGYSESSPGTWTPARKLNAQSGGRGEFGYSKEEIYARGEAIWGRQAWDDKATEFTISDDGTSLEARTNTGWRIMSEYASGVKPERGPAGPKGPLFVSRGKTNYKTRTYSDDGTLVSIVTGPITGFANVPLNEAFAKMTSDRYVDNRLDPAREEFLNLKMAGDLLGKFNQQGGEYEGWKQGPTANPSFEATEAQMDQARAWAKKVLGPKIKVEFKKITGYSGEFIDAQNTIEISTTAAAGTLGTLHHEAMHVFFRDFVKGNDNVKAVFESIVNNPRIIAKLNALLDGYPAAQAQLTSGEERLAYTFQFWKAGLLQIDTPSTSLFRKIGKFFRAVTGMVRDSERALELFIAFDNGKMSEPSAAGKVIAKAMGQNSASLKFRRNLDGVIQGIAALVVPAGEILANSTSPTAQKLGKMMFTNPGDADHGEVERGLINARRSVTLQYTNIVNTVMEALSETDLRAVQRHLQKEVDTLPADPEQAAAVKKIRATLDRFHQYLTESGLDVGKVDNYYPVVWNLDKLLNSKAEFIDMLTTKYAAELRPTNGDVAEAAERVYTSLITKDGVDSHLPAGREDGVLNPFFASQGNRTLPWLRGEDREAYLDKNIEMTLSRYFSQGAHAAEYTRRFGMHGTKLDDMLFGTKFADPKKPGVVSRKQDGIEFELTVVSHEKLRRGQLKDEEGRKKWLSRQMRDITTSVGAMEGALGKDVSDGMRKFNSWMAVYQNVRLLPLSLFSSFVDPLSIVARGTPLNAAFETFGYSMREVFRTWGDVFRDMPPERQKDEWQQLSEHIGSSEIAMFSHHAADEYASVYMTPGAKKINDKLFVLNGMEAWNRGTRIMATKWAVRFLEKHAGLPDKTHSARWLKELGLDPSMITLDDGKLVTDRHQLVALKGISLEQATAEIAPIHAALNRWVEGSVLTPNAGQRPGWSSDPNYATVFHLKQFSYSFHQTVLKRATNELKEGNLAPLGALSLFIPTMICADVMKGLIQGGGSLPGHMAGMNVGDWFLHGAQRAGLAGIGNVGMDAGADWASLGGPAIEQIVDAMRDGFGEKTALKAMPMNALYGELVKGGGMAAVAP